ncbi:BCCT family transporter, partial [Actinomadura adrarensis]
GPVRQRVFWGLSEGLLAASLIVLGGDAALEALQQVITVVGLPIFILTFLMMFSLAMGLKRESHTAYAAQLANMQRRAEPPAKRKTPEQEAPAKEAEELAGDAPEKV